MDILTVVLGVIGGLALFLYGIYVLSQSLQRAAGERLRSMLTRITNNRFKGILTGAAVTATIQSSSMTTVILISLVNSGLLTLRQTVSVIMGANIGTTLTAQLVAFEIGTFSLLIFAIGFLIFFLTKNRKYSFIGQILLGFGLLFLGMNIMSQGVAPLKESQFFADLLLTFGTVPILGIIAGAAVTALIQSSSATTGIVIAMAMSNVISLESAIPIILGANIGTCATALIASVGSSLTAKKVAIAHLFFNVIGVLIFFPFVSQFANIVSVTALDVPRQIANAHTMFNITASLIMIPFLGLFVKLINRIVPGKEVKVDGEIKYINKRLLNTPLVALSQAGREINRMGEIVSEMFKKAIKFFKNNDQVNAELVFKQEDIVDKLHRALDEYLIDLSSKDLRKPYSTKLTCYAHCITDIERVGDYINNLVELIQNKNKEGLKFSEQANKELDQLFKEILQEYEASLKALEHNDKKIAKSVLRMEEKITPLIRKFQTKSMKRIQKSICDPAANVIYTTMLKDLERINKHAYNIASIVVYEF